MLFWRKKLKEPKKCDLNRVERFILDTLTERIQKPYNEKLVNQIQYLKLIRRIKYKSDTVTELYPESLGTIPQDYLFSRTEEFRLAELKFQIMNTEYSCEVYCCLGTIFDIKIFPILKADENGDEIYLKKVSFNSEFDENVNEAMHNHKK